MDSLQMTTQDCVPLGSTKSLILLSRLLLSRPDTAQQFTPSDLKLTRQEFEEVAALSHSNHVIVRGLEMYRRIAGDAGDDTRKEWAATSIAAERARIENAIPFLRAICDSFESPGYDVTVIKSLDHWPDLGSDLDLYTNADSADVIRLMRQGFNAQVAPRSWGDRLAHKWNFVVPGLPEAVEVHMGRLGQTGEQLSIARAVARRARTVDVGGYSFRVPSASERLMISTLQRMYRHFYFRLCDIIDTKLLSETNSIDYEDLRRSAQAAGIWQGVATYLVIVSDYVEHFRGEGLDLPPFVRENSRFGGEAIRFRRDFLRVPILPQSAGLYASQLAMLLRKRELKNTARLSLLPCLATAAAVGQKITGSDKGIW
jgi:hypothetical protein